MWTFSKEIKFTNSLRMKEFFRILGQQVVFFPPLVFLLGYNNYNYLNIVS